MDSLATRDKKMQQIYNHIEELTKLLNDSSKNIRKKEKTNKYLSDVKKEFDKYNKNIDDLKYQQLAYFNSLKLYLQSLDNDEYNGQIKEDLDEIDKEIKKLG